MTRLRRTAWILHAGSPCLADLEHEVRGNHSKPPVPGRPLQPGSGPRLSVVGEALQRALASGAQPTLR